MVRNDQLSFKSPMDNAFVYVCSLRKVNSANVGNTECCPWFTCLRNLEHGFWSQQESWKSGVQIPKCAALNLWRLLLWHRHALGFRNRQFRRILVGSAQWRIQDVVLIMPNPETHPSNFLQRYYLKYFSGWPVSGETKKRELLFSDPYWTISRKISLWLFSSSLSFWRKGAMLLMWNYPREWYLAWQHSCCRVFKPYNLTCAFTEWEWCCTVGAHGTVSGKA